MTWEVIHGDCLDVMREMGDDSVDAVITDPPYGLDFPYPSYEDTRENLARLIEAFFPLARRVCRRLVVLPGISQVSFYPDPEWIGCVTWNTTGSRGYYGYTQWMPVLLYGPDLDGIGSVNGGVLKSDTLRISGGGGVGFRRQDSESLHVCPKPITIMNKIIERFTEPDDFVLDPFCGSGSTGVSCRTQGRRFMGVEIAEEYCDLARGRIATAAQQTSLFT